MYAQVIAANDDSSQNADTLTWKRSVVQVQVALQRRLDNAPRPTVDDVATDATDSTIPASAVNVCLEEVSAQLVVTH